MIYPIEVIENKPYIGIGGGSKTKTFSFRTVLRKNQTGNGFILKKAQFIKSSGQRVNSFEQGLTELQKDDIIILVSGNIPVVKDNPMILINAFQVLEIMMNEKYVQVNPVSISFSDIPEKAWSGSMVYHNKDGSLFSGDEP